MHPFVIGKYYDFEFDQYSSPGKLPDARPPQQKLFSTDIIRRSVISKDFLRKKMSR